MTQRTIAEAILDVDDIRDMIKSRDRTRAEAAAEVDAEIAANDFTADVLAVYSEARTELSRPCDWCSDSGRVECHRGPFTRWEPCDECGAGDPNEDPTPWY